jgi:hypothetical protein
MGWWIGCEDGLHVGQKVTQNLESVPRKWYNLQSLSRGMLFGSFSDSSSDNRQ